MELSEFLLARARPKDVSSALPEDVVSFLIWKDQGGRTVVHDSLCPYIGNAKIKSCGCPRRLSYGTVDSLIGRLRAIFASSGRGGDWFPLLNVGNPAADRSVKQYLSCVREEQLKDHVIPQRAYPVILSDIEMFSRGWDAMLKDISLSPSEMFVIVRDQAFFKALFFSADRAADLLGVITPTILRFPDNSGFLLRQVWTKSLRSDEANIFALKGLDLYFNICKTLSIDISSGYLFRTVSKEGLITSKALEAPAAQARLNTYVHKFLIAILLYMGSEVGLLFPWR